METSTETETIVREVPVEVHDTVTLTIEADTVWQIAKDSSTLSNEWCRSRAYIREDGTLYHDLTTIAQEKKQEAKYVYIRRDSTITKTKTITKERELTWMERVKIKYSAGIIIFLLILILAEAVWKRNRTR
jgi:hypothetical protein